MSKIIKLHSPASSIRVSQRPFETLLRGSGDTDACEQSGLHERTGRVYKTSSTSTLPKSADVEQRLKDEYKAGFDEGRRFTEKSLRDELTDELDENKKRVEMLLLNITEEHKRMQTASERIIVKLALAIAERIVKREVTIDNGLVLRQIHESAKRVIGVERIKLRVNPLDEEYVREHRAKLLTSTDSVRELVIEGDETIECGGCILESDSGNVDAQIATQLERIEIAMIGEQSDK